MNPRFSVVMPYFNEREYILHTLESWKGQNRLPDQLILVDNSSTDGTETLCRDYLQDCPLFEILYLREPRAGKTHALERGCHFAKGEFIAFSDADTYYPPHYLELCDALARESPADIVAFMAQALEAGPEDPAVRKRLMRTVFWSKLLTRKAFTGNAGHVFRRAALEKAGGFSTRHWDLMYADHEVMHRMFKVGRSLYHKDLWCLASERRADRSHLRWDLWERMVYRYTPHILGDWYFYSFLRGRLLKKGMAITNLRRRDWEERQTTAKT